MNCPKCGGDNPDTSKFCGHCGSRLPDIDPAADIKKTAAFDLGQLPFGGGGNPAPGGGGPTLMQTALQTAITPDPDPNAVTSRDPDPAPVATPVPVAAPTPQPLTPVPSEPPRGDSPPVSASAGPTTVQPVVADEPEPEPEPAAAEPEPAAAEPEPAAPQPEPAADEPEGQDRTAEEPPPAAAEFNSAPRDVVPEPKKAEPKKAAFGADAKAVSTTPGDAEPSEVAKAATKKDATPAPGQFRETKWFMDALDPEKLNRVEMEDVRDRGEHFVDDGSEIDESFSLRSGMHPKVRPTHLDLAKAEIEAAERRSGKGNGPLIGLVIVVLGGIAAAAWFLFLK
ncbi:MAG: hypothetical protein KC613_19330 [Myxococcales bacterium]|nr:hypothetical protein [Myxococcales bacterium]MCB9525868.1 hypothetical protein [Myxococcales bacterium]